MGQLGPARVGDRDEAFGVHRDVPLVVVGSTVAGRDHGAKVVIRHHGRHDAPVGGIAHDGLEWVQARVPDHRPADDACRPRQLGGQLISAERQLAIAGSDRLTQQDGGPAQQAAQRGEVGGLEFVHRRHSDRRIGAILDAVDDEAQRFGLTIADHQPQGPGRVVVLTGSIEVAEVPSPRRCHVHYITLLGSVS